MACGLWGDSITAARYLNALAQGPGRASGLQAQALKRQLLQGWPHRYAIAYGIETELNDSMH